MMESCEAVDGSKEPRVEAVGEGEDGEVVEEQLDPRVQVRFG